MRKRVKGLIAIIVAFLIVYQWFPYSVTYAEDIWPGETETVTGDERDTDYTIYGSGGVLNIKSDGIIHSVEAYANTDRLNESKITVEEGGEILDTATIKEGVIMETAGKVALLDSEGDLTITGGEIGTLNVTAGSITVEGSVSVADAVINMPLTGSGSMSVTGNLEYGSDTVGNVRINVQKTTTISSSSVDLPVSCGDNAFTVKAGSEKKTYEDYYGYTVTSDTIDFGTVAEGYGAIEAQTITITNTKTEPVTVRAVTTGSYYSVTATVDSSSVDVNEFTIAAGKSAIISVTPLTGLSAGGYEATLKFNILGDEKEFPVGFKVEEATTEATTEVPTSEATTEVPAPEATTEVTTEATTQIAVQATTQTPAKATTQAAAQKITKKKGKGSVSIADYYYGAKPSSPTVVSSTNGVKNVKIQYKKRGSSDRTYSGTRPTEVGDYTMRVVFPANDTYEKLVVTDDFSITYMPVPSSPYQLEGTKGDNNYYISKVKLVAKKGYLVSTELNGTYTKTIYFDKSTSKEKIYYKNIATGALSNGLVLPKLLIDKNKPVISGITNGNTYYTQSRRVVIKDEALKSVVVNGRNAILNGDTVNLYLTAAGGVTEYSIRATDLAGNRTSVTVTMAAEWTRTGLIPPNQKVKLNRMVKYRLGAGKWMVNGDSTVYSGNADFYVNKDSEYTFTNK